MFSFLKKKQADPDKAADLRTAFKNILKNNYQNLLNDSTNVLEKGSNKKGEIYIDYEIKMDTVEFELFDYAKVRMFSEMKRLDKDNPGHLFLSSKNIGQDSEKIYHLFRTYP